MSKSIHQAHLERMVEAATENVAMKIKIFLAEQWGPLKEAGWSDEHVGLILNDAVRQCDSRPGQEEEP